MYDIQTNEEIDEASLLAKKGYTPRQARDVLALTGDAVDNIPGIPGVGPKTAIKWIQQYGDIDNLIAHKDELGGKIGEVFRSNLQVLENARKLVELQFDVPIVPLDWELAKVRPDLLPKLAPIFHELGFTKLLTTLEQVVHSYRELMPMHAEKPEAGSQKSEKKIKKQKTTIAPIMGGLFDQPVEESRVDGENMGGTLMPWSSGPPPSSSAEPGADVPIGLRPVVGEYHLVNTRERLMEMIATLREEVAVGGWLAVDTETDALGAMVSNLCGISLSAKEGTGYYVPVKGVGDTLDGQVVREVLGPLLADANVKKLGQNLKYDINSLRCFGLQLNGIDFDTMVASYVIDSSRMSHGMDSLAADLLGLKTIPISDLIGKASQQISFADVPLDRACQYAGEDADVTLRLAHVLLPQLQKLGAETEKLFRDVEMPLVQVLADMEYHGVMIDAGPLKALSGKIEGKLEELQGRIKAAAGMDFNQDSPRQLAEVLFKHLNLPVIKKTKTGPSTDITVLEKLADQHPVPALIVEYRQLTKLKNTYLDTLVKLPNKKTNRVHASFNQTVAETGRLSSSDPNLQNIPVKTDIGREIRRAFVACPGFVLISADYSQIELRVLAHFCQEKALLDAFAKNMDIHRLVAAELNGVPESNVTPEMRAVAKVVNFGIIYGQTGFGLSQVLKIPQEQANAYVTSYRQRFPAIERFTHECVMQAAAHGYVTTILGRRRQIPDIHSSIQSRRMFGQRAALNSVIQGSAADLIKLAMVNLHKCLADKPQEIRMLMQIHDELVFECRTEKADEYAKLIRQEMEHAMELRVPLKVDLGIGPNWLENK
ncbi:MAG: DNA polymerase I [Phycisphaerales bacterium]|nr:DNA polymerase I [Phycisphaerales bacterium]